MLEKYQKALEPKSLLEIVPKEVLQSQMQGFFYGHSAGMVLMYDVGRDAQGRPELERLEPVDPDPKKEQDWRLLLKNFNPFCAKFRETPERNAMCEACDLAHALAEFSGTAKRPHYSCHMGLIDITIPISVGGRVRAVIFGGQKIVKDALPMRAEIERNIQSKAADITPDLKRLMDKEAVPKVEVDAFQESFFKFAQALQTTVSAFDQAIREKAERAVLVEMGEALGRSLAGDEWRTTARTLLTELEASLRCGGLFVLFRRRSYYEVLALSPGCQSWVARPLSTDGEGPSAGRLPVMYAVDLQEDRWHDLARDHAKLRAWREHLRWLPQDASVSACSYIGPDSSNVPLSAVLVVVWPAASVPPASFGAKREFLKACGESIAHHAHMHALFDHQADQQAEFARRVAFTGHHLKTPLQNAFSNLREIKILDDNAARRRELCDQTVSYLMEAQADALMLQATGKAKAEPVDVYDLLQDLSRNFTNEARTTGVTLTLAPRPAISCKVSAVPQLLRIALSNLFDNAVKYSFAHKDISINLGHILGRHLQCVITNVGVAPLPQKQKVIFKYRDRAKTLDKRKERPGQGIGLSQTTAILESMGGSFDFNQVVEGKTTEGVEVAKTSVTVLLRII